MFALPLRVLAQPAEKRPLAGLVFEVRGGSLRANRSLQCALRRLGGQVGGAAPEAIQLNLDDNSAIRAGDDVPVRSETRRSVRQLVVRRRVLRELQTMLGELVPPSSRTGGRPLHALVVEDNVVNQKVLSKLLENLGVSVTCVANGALAVSAWKQHPLDVIFMDVEMPVMNGLDATIAIRAMPGGIEIPIVGVSANATPEEQQRGLEAGMNCYLQKPIRKEQVSKVLRALYRNQPLSAHLASI
jgi:CheY-like chemotaxis protein